MDTTQRKTALAGAAGTTRSNYIPSSMESCPKFEKCRAQICPLDPLWYKRKMLPEESCCQYLLEASKNDAEAVFKGAGLSELYKAMVRLTPEITARHTRIRRALERAKLTGSRMTRRFPAKLGGSL